MIKNVINGRMGTCKQARKVFTDIVKQQQYEHKNY